MIKPGVIKVKNPERIYSYLACHMGTLKLVCTNNLVVIIVIQSIEHTAVDISVSPFLFLPSHLWQNSSWPFPLDLPCLLSCCRHNTHTSFSKSGKYGWILTHADTWISVGCLLLPSLKFASYVAWIQFVLPKKHRGNSLRHWNTFASLV